MLRYICSCVGIFLILLTSGGCIDELIDQRPPGAVIRHKKYSKPPLSRAELDNLLHMAMYNGRPDRYGVLVMRGRTEKRGVDPVVFSHATHRVEYTCRVCHVELEFSMKKGESGITREDYLDGRFCGACHNGKIAFSVEFACDRCHLSKQKLNAVYSSPEYEKLAADLPRLTDGDKIDWVNAIKTSVIRPKNILSAGDEQTSLPLPSNLYEPLKWYTNVSRIHVSFPHKEHIAWLDCSNCHPDVFKIESFGTEEFDKEKNLYGYYCGMCHMTVAFPMNSCSRCHPGLSGRFSN
nr:hypothetical protein [Desulfobulbaceae bacterium]